MNQLYNFFSQNVDIFIANKLPSRPAFESHEIPRKQLIKLYKAFINCEQIFRALKLVSPIQIHLIE